MNVFFSNFTEAGVEPFHRDEVTDETLVRFGVLHTRINSPQRIQPAPGRPGYERLAVRHVDAAVLKYFAVHVSGHRSVGLDAARLTFVGDHYVYPGADGETYPFAQVDRLTDIGNGEFAAAVSVYLGEDSDADWYGTAVADL